VSRNNIVLWAVSNAAAGGVPNSVPAAPSRLSPAQVCLQAAVSGEKKAGVPTQLWMGVGPSTLAKPPRSQLAPNFTMSVVMAEPKFHSAKNAVA